MKHIFAITLVATLVLALGCEESAPSTTSTSQSTGPPEVAAAAPSTPAAAAPAAQGGPTIGEMAPEIEGVDLDGVEFKLSDYRGKVVMLDFYGDW